MRRITGLLFIALIWIGLPAATPHARELAAAPEAAIIGFSADGRYFAYEQFLYDDLDETVTMAIDILDRTTGRSVEGFPLGFIGTGPDGDYPAKVGSAEIDVVEGLAGLKQLHDRQSAVRRAAAPALRAYRISGGYFRHLAGSPVADRAPPPHFDFVLHPSLDGAITDMQDINRLSVRLRSLAPGSCIGGGFERTSDPIVLERRVINRETGVSQPSEIGPIPWPLADDACPLGIRITDILTLPYGREDPTRTIAVAIVLATSAAPHAESARYLARFIELP